MKVLSLRTRRQACRLEFADQNLPTMREEKMIGIFGNHISNIFQESMISLNPTYTICDQLIAALLCHGRGTRADAVDQAVFLPEKVGISATDVASTSTPTSSPGPPPAYGHWPNPNDEAGGGHLLRAHLFLGYLCAVQGSEFTV